jgi:hypothetical protein
MQPAFFFVLFVFYIAWRVAAHGKDASGLPKRNPGRPAGFVRQHLLRRQGCSHRRCPSTLARQSGTRFSLCWLLGLFRVHIRRSVGLCPRLLQCHHRQEQPSSKVRQSEAA